MQDQPVTCRWDVVWARVEQEQCHGCTKVLGTCTRGLCVQVRLRVFRLHRPLLRLTALGMVLSFTEQPHVEEGGTIASQE